MLDPLLITLLNSYSSPKISNLKILIDALNRSLYGGESGKLPLPGVALIKRFEGFSSRAYPDPLSGGLPITNGWGSTKKWDGSNWKIGEKISREDADKLLILELERDYLPKLQKIPCWNELNPRQQGALLSFAYNLGADFYGHPQFTKITAMLRDRDWSNAKSIFLLYRNPGTRVERGLKLRRLTEAYLFLYK
jgi:lysozyme